MHGLRGDHEAVELGGRDAKLRDKISQELSNAGFIADVVTAGAHAAVNQRNICNGGQRKIGVQLEITRGLRRTLLRDSRAPKLPLFARAIRTALKRIERSDDRNARA